MLRSRQRRPHAAARQVQVVARAARSEHALRSRRPALAELPRPAAARFSLRSNAATADSGGRGAEWRQRERERGRRAVSRPRVPRAPRRGAASERIDRWLLGAGVAAAFGDDAGPGEPFGGPSEPAQPSDDRVESAHACTRGDQLHGHARQDARRARSAGAVGARARRERDGVPAAVARRGPVVSRADRRPARRRAFAVGGPSASAQPSD